MSTQGNNLLAQYYAQNQGLPDGYEAVEYLESTGTQWIDTGATTGSGVKSFTTAGEIAWLTTGSNRQLSGANDNQWIGVHSGRWEQGSNTAGSKYQIGTFYRAVVKSYAPTVGSGSIISDLYVDDILDVSGKYQGNFEFLTDRTHLIYGLAISKNRPISYMCHARVKYWRLYRQNKQIRNFIPCIRKSDGKPGLYDLCKSICPLTGTPFYINAGIGEFVTP